MYQATLTSVPALRTVLHLSLCASCCKDFTCHHCIMPANATSMGTTRHRTSLTRRARAQLKSVEGFEPGQQLKADELFKVGDFVDVAGTSVGKGFQGAARLGRCASQGHGC